MLKRKTIPAQVFRFALLALIPLLAGKGIEAAPAGPIVDKVRIYPLPGGLDDRPMLNDNSPEWLSQSGILVSTLPNRGQTNSPFLDFAFNGDFGVFSHHYFVDRFNGEKQLYLGLVASNFGTKAVNVTLRQGASYLSQPGEPHHRPLPVVTHHPGTAPDAAPDPTLYAGAGDRAALDMLAGRGELQNQVFRIPAGSSGLIASLPVITDKVTQGLTLDGKWHAYNGRSSLMHLHADGPVYMSSLAWVAKRADGGFAEPSLDDYRSLIHAGKFSGWREKFSNYDEQNPPRGSFLYGRVAGVSPGVKWQGRLWQGEQRSQLPGPGEKAGYPIASTYIKRFGTGQNQSGKMLRRYADSPPENHGNYGLVYDLELPFVNDTAADQTYTLSLTEPLNPFSGPQIAPDPLREVTYADPPTGSLMFQGSVRLQWKDAQGRQQQQYSHLSMHNGRLSPPFWKVTVPAGKSIDARLSLVYPADVTPPQLLVIGRE